MDEYTPRRTDEAAAELLQLQQNKEFSDDLNIWYAVIDFNSPNIIHHYGRTIKKHPILGYCDWDGNGFVSHAYCRGHAFFIGNFGRVEKKALVLL